MSFVGRGLVRILVEEVFERFLIGTARVAVPILTFGAVAVEGAAPRPPHASLWWRGPDDRLILRRGLGLVLGAALLFAGLFATAGLVRMAG